jgi:hypothetical protein
MTTNKDLNNDEPPHSIPKEQKSNNSGTVNCWNREEAGWLPVVYTPVRHGFLLNLDSNFNKRYMINVLK